MKILTILLLSLLTQCGGPQDQASSVPAPSGTAAHMDIAFYNVENLFDTEDDRAKKDEDFTPEGRNEWSQGRYEKKLKQLAKVIQAMDQGHGLPAIIGLAEIENESVVQDLGRTVLPEGYTVITHNSSDRRGIDVALMYRHELLKVVEHRAIRIQFKDSGYNSRDILHVVLETTDAERFHVFVNHWPSRREGQKESEHRRLSAAKTLRSAIDDVQSEDKEAQVIILGDFNDYPDNKSITKVLKAKAKDGSRNGELVNLAYELHAEDKGTYPYKGDWGMLDQAIVSDALFEKKGFYVSEDGLEVFQKDFMMYYDKKYKEYKPNRTYGGPRYYGGFSDHLPILLHLNSAN